MEKILCEKELRLELEDREWSFEYTDHDRLIARAIVVDDEGFFYFVRANRDDDFGKATLIETSGGGVEPGEAPDEAILRELKEELGAETEILCKLGVVSDYYNLIHRHNVNNYFLCRVLSFGEKHMTQDEIESFHLSTLKLRYEEAVDEYEKCRDSKLGRLIGNRELPVLKRARELLLKGKSMEIYDISQEVFGCEVYPGDPAPVREKLSDMSDGALYNLTAFSMCAHNGTHADAPYHFYNDGKTINQVSLESFVGFAYVAEHEGEITGCDAEMILKDAAAADPRAAERILVKGKAVLTKEGAEVFAEAGIRLFGNESQTVGPEDAPMEVHLIMLGAGIVLLEGIRLEKVPEGVYILSAAPLNLGGADGAPCRAVLLRL